MTYRTDLINTPQDEHKWPDFRDSFFLGELGEMAEGFFNKESIEGYLASLLIYLQISEEMLKVLLADAEFYLKLSVFPKEITFPERKKPTFGQLINDLRNTISFRSKAELISKCESLNEIRLKFVHHLTKQSSLPDVKKQISVARSLYEEINSLFIHAHLSFDFYFRDFRESIDINAEEKYIW